MHMCVKTAIDIPPGKTTVEYPLIITVKLLLITVTLLVINRRSTTYGCPIASY